MKKGKIVHAGDFSHIQEFALSALQFSHETMKLSALRDGGRRILKKVCTVVMGYTSTGDDYQSSYT